MTSFPSCPPCQLLLCLVSLLGFLQSHHVHSTALATEEVKPAPRWSAAALLVLPPISLTSSPRHLTSISKGARLKCNYKRPPLHHPSPSLSSSSSVNVPSHTKLFHTVTPHIHSSESCLVSYPHCDQPHQALPEMAPAQPPKSAHMAFPLPFPLDFCWFLHKPKLSQCSGVSMTSAHPLNLALESPYLVQLCLTAPSKEVPASPST